MPRPRTTKPTREVLLHMLRKKKYSQPREKGTPEDCDGGKEERPSRAGGRARRRATRPVRSHRRRRRRLWQRALSLSQADGRPRVLQVWSCRKSWIDSKLDAHTSAIRCPDAGCKCTLYVDDAKRMAGAKGKVRFNRLRNADYKNRLVVTRPCATALMPPAAPS